MGPNPHFANDHVQAHGKHLTSISFSIKWNENAYFHGALTRTETIYETVTWPECTGLTISIRTSPPGPSF